MGKDNWGRCDTSRSRQKRASWRGGLPEITILLDWDEHDLTDGPALPTIGRRKSGWPVNPHRCLGSSIVSEWLLFPETMRSPLGYRRYQRLGMMESVQGSGACEIEEGIVAALDQQLAHRCQYWVTIALAVDPSRQAPPSSTTPPTRSRFRYSW